MKSHIGPNGPSRCTAQKDNCPYGASDNHFHTMAEAKQEYTARLEKAYDTVETVKVTKRRLSVKEKELHAKHAEQAKKIVELRADAGGGVTFEDANPERAQRRLKESIEFANSRFNEHLVEKLSKATVLPSGAFKMADGRRVNTDALIKKNLVLKAVDSQRELALKELSKLAREGGNKESKFKATNDSGSYTLTIGEGVDEEAFEKLSASQRKACMSPKEGLNIDLARENIPPAKLRQIVNQTQTLDFIYGKAADVGQEDLKVSTDFKGKTTDEKMQSGVKNIADFYAKVNTDHGKIRDMKTYTKDGKEAIKTAVADKKTNVFIPARSQYNGAVVSGRQNLDHAKAKEILTPEELKSITLVEDKPDVQKAQAVLSAKDFDKIFKAKKATLRVLESKD